MGAEPVRGPETGFIARRLQGILAVVAGLAALVVMNVCTWAYALVVTVHAAV